MTTIQSPLFPTELQRRELAREFVSLLNDLMPSIDPDNGPLAVTFGVSWTPERGFCWDYQTGDNSFHGSAYGYREWAVVDLDRDSDVDALGTEAVGQLDF
jgi:hypothetical protein